MIRFFSVYLIIYFAGTGKMMAQRLSIGANMNINAYQNTRLSDPYVFSPNSYFIYYAGNSKRDHRAARGQSMNAIAAGLNFNLDYKRFMFTTELLFGNRSIKLPVRSPSSLGSLLGDEYFSFQVNQTYLASNFLLLTKLTTKANGPFIQTGISLASSRFQEKQSQDFPFLITLYTSENEMYSILYSNQLKYTYGLFGIGTKKDDRYTSLRFSQRILMPESDRKLAKYYQIELVIARTLNFQKLRKGYKIYLSE